MKDLNSDAAPQPEPTDGREVIWPLVVADIQERASAGLVKYGTHLQADNGRDPEVDEYQELLDAVMYRKQRLIERRRERENARAVMLALSEARTQIATLTSRITAGPQETSETISSWQLDTFGAADLTAKRLRSTHLSIEIALGKAWVALQSKGDRALPNLSRAIRALEEMAELIELLAADDSDQKAPTEVADISIVLEGINGFHDVDGLKLRDSKMSTNRLRTWKQDGDGHAQHVEECLYCETAVGCQIHLKFTCARCNKLVSWKDGGSELRDEGGDMCDDCWLDVQPAPETTK